ncbi:MULTISPECIES: response regulator transcription factor [Pseudomonas]|uniref:response regulator transcription factor n=1 Tax=Pseudomonas TaxID=286 RepID=UPI0005A9AC9F|nr:MULTISPECIES: response regulator transcription factor [Pseudomonas]AZD35984.1 capsula synthesis response regulator transcription regulator protein [Pseudomonas chlororaphis subsp. aurantiaca]AZD42321.1 capsula synthesis response regulator transcription regulator protein [Pseudomonas chlororaphis subsp. aurantiaca]AZD48520.1 capsula synthesis response regulator transcription regulator protein [Pseudomonas chlororaphis subsp. aurantiaca]AZD79707.1 capsula synthesis response regulator transcrip
MNWSIVNPLRLAVLDDHSLIRLALKSRLAREAEFKVVGVYAGSSELLSAMREIQIDLLILDYKLQDGELDGLNLIRQLHKQYPDLKILISSSEERPAVINMAIGAGAGGFLGKSQPVDDLITAIRTTASGRAYLSAQAAFELRSLPVPGNEPEQMEGKSQSQTDTFLNNPLLSPKEKEVLRCCLDGLGVTQIALKFSRSRKTISGQKQSAFKKLGIRGDAELFMLQHSPQSTL